MDLYCVGLILVKSKVKACKDDIVKFPLKVKSLFLFEQHIFETALSLKRSLRQSATPALFRNFAKHAM